ncbi:nucleoside phosphorylase [Promethearchaeum syntrophicum]|uniref:Nucleoside phosphorylase n=1 Tax=Promethearchaeum syntrophicum TaxID=2594042 RepID=A0A5B9DF02_9ARCH|nr:nucleoside phosphorylase [Candidatus Prometheoarchaeum syntrophicum]QEE17625.1 Purine nucleoside phosphorylase [Candidatus Prometheoarchaeum syntrophicum]
MLKKKFPILEFDPNQKALLNPSELIKPIDIPKACIITFFQEIIDKLVKDGKARVIDIEHSEIGEHPIYEVINEGGKFVMFHCGLGAPLSAALFEYVIALGCKNFIVCGSSGLLDKSLKDFLLIPVSAVRDEGTSYHYLPPSREVEANAKAIEAIEKTLKKHNVKYILSKTWTTDAFYRETPAKIALRKEEGCSTVEMEAAALFAVANFRGVIIGQILYGSDDVSGDEWSNFFQLEKKYAGMTLRERIFWLAVEACLLL